MGQYYDRRLIEERVSSFSHLFMGMLNLGKRLTEVFQRLSTGNQR